MQQAIWVVGVDFLSASLTRLAKCCLSSCTLLQDSFKRLPTRYHPEPRGIVAFFFSIMCCIQVEVWETWRNCLLICWWYPHKFGFDFISAPIPIYELECGGLQGILKSLQSKMLKVYEHLQFIEFLRTISTRWLRQGFPLDLHWRRRCCYSTAHRSHHDARVAHTDLGAKALHALGAQRYSGTAEWRSEPFNGRFGTAVCCVFYNKKIIIRYTRLYMAI